MSTDSSSSGGEEGEYGVDHFYEVLETNKIKFKRIPGKGLAMRIRFRNLGDSLFVDDTVTEIFDSVIIFCINSISSGKICTKVLPQVIDSSQSWQGPTFELAHVGPDRLFFT